MSEIPLDLVLTVFDILALSTLAWFSANPRIYSVLSSKHFCIKGLMEAHPDTVLHPSSRVRKNIISPRALSCWWALVTISPEKFPAARGGLQGDVKCSI